MSTRPRVPYRAPQASATGFRPRGARLTTLLVLTVAFAGALTADNPPAAQFILRTASGPTHSGTLQAIGPDWSVRLQDRAKPVAIAGADVVSLRRQGLPLPAHPTGPQVVLTSGDRVPLHAQPGLQVARERLHFRPRSALHRTDVEFKPPLRTVALVWLATPANTEDAGLLLRRLLSTSQPQDLVLLRDGDRVQGTLEALGPDGCHVLAGRRRVDLALDGIAAIVFGSRLRVRTLPAEPYGHLVLTDGTRLALRNARIDASHKKLRAKTTFGATLEVPLERVAALDVWQGAAVYLSDLEPRAYEHTPFLGVSWPFIRDGTVAGRELRLDGVTYDKGLGMHSTSRLTYGLGGKYRRFEADVGLDEQTGKRGRVRIAVLVDGKELAQRELSGSERPLRLRVDVRGARELTLRVHFGRFGDVQGHVNWGHARLIR